MSGTDMTEAVARYQQAVRTYMATWDGALAHLSRRQSEFQIRVDASIANVERALAEWRAAQ